jgi:quercetin dioxygenase-like cupin family protein
MAQHTPTTPQFFQASALPLLPLPYPGLTARVAAGDHLMVTFGRLEPGVALPLHSHPHEQITYVLTGMAQLQIGDEKRDLGPGDGGLIPGNVTHGIVGVGPIGCTFLEVYTPLREEYLALLRQVI